MLDAAVEFTECRQGSGPHPHDQVLVLVAIVVSVVGIQFHNVALPVFGTDGLIEA